MKKLHKINKDSNDSFFFSQCTTGNKTHELENNGKQVIFAFEEAIGFMFGTAVKDKDGVSAAVHLATLAAFLHKHGLTLVQQLDEIYKEYGYHISENSYFICHDGAVIEKIFNRLRNFNGDGSVRIYSYFIIQLNQ